MSDARSCPCPCGHPDVVADVPAGGLLRPDSYGICANCLGLLSEHLAWLRGPEFDADRAAWAGLRR